MPTAWKPPWRLGVQGMSVSRGSLGGLTARCGQRPAGSRRVQSGKRSPGVAVEPLKCRPDVFILFTSSLSLKTNNSVTYNCNCVWDNWGVLTHFLHCACYEI